MMVARYGRPDRALAFGLSALAGYVDVVGFMTIGGFFVSFMSGNTTRLAVGLARHGHDAALAGGLIALFFIGVVAGALAGDMAGGRRRPAVLALVTTLLALSAFAGTDGRPWIATALMAMAMGAENAVFQREGEVSVGLTYMTGTLVKCGQRVAAALRGGDRGGWIPHLMLWLALASGAVLGALAWRLSVAMAPWVAVAAALMLTFAAAIMDRPWRSPKG